MQHFYSIGIDIGTGSTKAVALHHHGEVLCTAQRFYTAQVSGLTAEQDTEVVWDAFQQCIREIISKVKEPPQAVSLSSAMHSLLLANEENEWLTNAVLWSDTRSTAIARELRTSSLGERLYTFTGTPIHSMSPLCKIRWWQLHDPALFKKTAKFISIKEAVWHRLFGEYVIDYSVASATGLFNISTLQWEEEALSFAGIHAGQLSQPVPVSYCRSDLASSVAAQLGLPAGTPFIIGGSDGCMANLGSLCLQPDKAAITIGTSGAVRITATKPVINWERMIFNYLLTEDHFVCGGAINNGGNVFHWLLHKLFAQHESVKTFEQLFQAIAGVPPGADGLLFLPYLHGERAPIWDEESCGVFIGVTARHTLPHFARAAAEGICFALYHILASLEEVAGQVNEVRISGGLIHTPVMLQMLANITGKKVVVQQNDDASAIGAAYLAQKYLGVINDFSDIADGAERQYVPQPGASLLYQNLFNQYKSLYPLLRETMHSLHQLRH